MEDLEFDMTWLEWVWAWAWTSNLDDLDFDLSGMDIADNADTGAEGEDLSVDGQPVEDPVEPVVETPIEDVETTDEALSEIDRILQELDEWAEESSDALDETQKIIEALKGVEWSEEAVTLLTWLQSENNQQKAQIEWLRGLINKLNKDKSELSVKNAELELYWGIDDAQLVYLNGNLSAARGWDEKSKDKIVGILDKLRSELTGKTLDDETNEDIEDKINMFSSYNDSKSDPNTKTSWIDSFVLEL